MLSLNNILKYLIIKNFGLLHKCRVIGRIAVVEEWRGKNIGAKIINVAEENIKRDVGKSVMLSAQVRVAAFYEKQGKAYLDQDCPHIWMKKNLGYIGK
ncbi:GNAT family N-acetyltransferase [Clostridium saccharoperbutylacetonicum]|uniref:GNAT family N-acetyltransferase n=1 Tax=Clostridium saccharoperbutylacetonicum TaxID=36745 RepID=UPI0039EA774A